LPVKIFSCKPDKYFSPVPIFLVLYPLIIPPKGTNTRAKIDQALAGKELEYTIAMELNGRDAAKIYVAMGLGISIVNEYYLRPEDKRNLFMKDISNYFGKAERGIITRKNGYTNQLTKEFINMLLRKFKIQS
jgi:DNA-binding transcriptional LysR family regulator